MDSVFATAHSFPLLPNPTPIHVTVVDGRPLSSGPISTHTSPLSMTSPLHTELLSFHVATLDVPVILGLSWLIRWNPHINWVTQTLHPAINSVPCSTTVLPTFSSVVPEPAPPPVPYSAVSSSPVPVSAVSSLTPAVSSLTPVSVVSPPSHSIVPAQLIPTKNVVCVPKKYHDFLHVFNKTQASSLPPHRPYDCTIDFIEGTPLPPFGPLYPLSRADEEILKTYVNDLLATGLIRHSTSPVACPVLLVPKPDNATRVCVDYRPINKVTQKIKYPMPLIESILFKMSGCTHFSKLDLRGAYNLVRIREGDEWKTAFRTPFGTFEYLVMPFGLTNAPGVFQHFMNDIFRDILGDFMVVYLDDILVFSTNQHDHDTHVATVLQRLSTHRLFVKLEKCAFDQTQVDFLGYIVSSRGISMDNTKVSTVLEWATPKSVKDVQRFLGFANFYRRFIHNFSAIVKPLTSLTRKNVVFNWSEECQRAFASLKLQFTTAPILAHVDYSAPFVLETDASDFALGAILSQKSPDGILHPVAFHSRKFSPAEINYEIYDKELLAIIDGFRVWRQFLVGTAIPVTVYSDHKNLEYFMTSRMLNRRQARWSTTLADYNFIITYRPGSQCEKADALSRRSEFQLNPDDPQVQNQQHILLQPRHFRLAAANFSLPTDGDLQTLLINSLPNDPHAQHIIPFLLQQPTLLPPPHNLHDYTFINDILFFKNKVYVPDGECRTLVLQQCHDQLLAGHYGKHKTVELIKRTYWWPKLIPSVVQFIASCDTCARSKAAKHHPYGLLQPLPIPTRPWGSISMDFVTALPPTPSGQDAILVVVDRLTKMSHFLPCKSTFTAQDTSVLVLQEIVRLHGLPDDITTDRGSVFMSAFWKGLFSLLGVKQNGSSAFHPQTDGQTERINQIMEQYLRCYVAYKQDNWCELLPFAEFTYNNTFQSSINSSPFKANYGFDPRFDTQPALIPLNNEAENRITTLLENQQLLHRELEKAQAKQKLAADRYRLRPPNFSVGDKVWLVRKHIKTNRPSDKLDYKKLGPFEIIQQINPVAFKLQLPVHFLIHPVFHVSLLEKYTPAHEPGRRMKVFPPDIIENTPEYEVEKILDAYYHNRKLYYVVSWKGGGPQDHSPEPVENLMNCQEAIEAYHRLYPGPIRTRKRIIRARRPPRS